MNIVPLTCPVNNYLVAIEKPFMDDVQTESGVALYRDTTFHPEQYAQTNGKVVSVPRYLQKETDVREGDHIFFSFMVVMDWEQRERNTPVHRNQVYFGGMKYWKVDLSQAYFRVRDDQMKMLNGYILLDIVEAAAVTTSLIIPEYLKKTAATGKGRVLASEETDVHVNDLVYFDHRFVETYEFWGKEFFVLKRERILAKT